MLCATSRTAVRAAGVLCREGAPAQWEWGEVEIASVKSTKLATELKTVFTGKTRGNSRFNFGSIEFKSLELK